MTNIFLAPRSNETAYANYVSSMSGIPRSKVESFLSDEELSLLGDTSSFHIWGCQPSLKNRWEQMQVGDYVMFYARGSFISVGRVSFKKFSEDLALALWPIKRDSHEPWSCVFFVDELQPINLPVQEFAKLTGYKIDRVQGFMPIKSGMQSILTQYGSADAFIDSVLSGISEEGLNELTAISSKQAAPNLEEIARLDELTRDKDEQRLEEALKSHAERAEKLKPEQISKTVTLYKRNRKLVDDIKQKYGNRCQICGFTFRTQSGKLYSEAAHIIPISSAKAGVDSPDNIWVLCANHHKMLDLGAIRAVSKSTYMQDGELKTLLQE